VGRVKLVFPGQGSDWRVGQKEVAVVGFAWGEKLDSSIARDAQLEILLHPSILAEKDFIDALGKDNPLG